MNFSKKILSGALAGLILLNSSMILNTAAATDAPTSDDELPEEVISWDDVTIPAEDIVIIPRPQDKVEETPKETISRPRRSRHLALSTSLSASAISMV